jgi:protein-disulfide isomerase
VTSGGRYALRVMRYANILMKKLILTGIVLSFVLTGCSLGEFKKVGGSGKKLSATEIQAKADAFINGTLMQPGTTATVEAPVLENGLYKIKVSFKDGRSVDAYMTTDGKTFFPQSLNVEETEKQAGGENASSTDQASDSAPSTVAKKTAKPVVEAFVMSHCPYGTQIEKGLIPVVKALGSKIDFKIKFVDYAMHGEKEVKEQTSQYCIQKEQNAKFIPYLTCFLKDSEGASACLKSAKVDEGKLNACISATDKKFDITKNFEDKSTYKGQFPPFNTDKADNEKYGVQGSPTLVINGTQSESGRDSASLLKAICGAFSKAPKECSTKLSAESPAPGFGEGTQAAGTPAAGCGQ